MPMWRCPHCGTPQAETARCWVCRRSSTACGTCRNFRRAVAGQLGYCGSDRQRRPLRGDEIRACWEAGTASTDSPAAGIPRSTPANELDAGRTPVRKLEFVEVESTGAKPSRGKASTASAPSDTATAGGGSVAGTAGPDGKPVVEALPVQQGWSLWGDADL